MWAMCILVSFGIVLANVLRAIHEQQLLRKNPEAYKALKETQAMEKFKRRQTMGSAAMGGIKIARMFMRR